MGKNITLAVLALLMVPIFIQADTSLSTSLVGDVCLVPVYNTSFMFPPQGGQIVRFGDQMYFYRDYMPGCENAANGAQVIAAGGNNTTPNPAPVPPPSVIALGGETCLVPVYNTNFMFPPEGGEIVQIGSQMYFYKNYLPGCGNAANGAQVILASSQAPALVMPAAAPVVPQAAAPAAQRTAPVTGCSN